MQWVSSTNDNAADDKMGNAVRRGYKCVGTRNGSVEWTINNGGKCDASDTDKKGKLAGDPCTRRGWRVFAWHPHAIVFEGIDGGDDSFCLL